MYYDHVTEMLLSCPCYKSLFARWKMSRSFVVFLLHFFSQLAGRLFTCLLYTLPFGDVATRQWRKPRPLRSYGRQGFCGITDFASVSGERYLIVNDILTLVGHQIMILLIRIVATSLQAGLAFELRRDESPASLWLVPHSHEPIVKSVNETKLVK